MVTISPFIKSFRVDFTKATELDVTHYVVHASKSNGFVPAENNVIYRGPDNTIFHTVSEGGVWYIKVTAVDIFGEDLLNYSNQLSVDVPTLDPLDTVAPNVPTGLALTTALDNSAQTDTAYINATWNANTESDLSHYVIQIYKTAVPTLVTEVPVEKGTTSYKFLGLIPNLSYSVKIKAVDQWKNASVFSGHVSVTTAKDMVAPATPSGVSATQGYASIFAKWSANTEADLAGYEVYLDTVSNFTPDTTTFTNRKFFGNALLCSIDIVRGTATYYLKICAIDHSGNRSGFATSSAVAFETAPAVPTGIVNGNLTSSVEIDTNGTPVSSVKITFTDGAARGNDFAYYEYRIKPNGGNYIYVTGLKEAEYTFKPVQPNVLYYVGVRAVSDIGLRSAFCADVSITSVKDAAAPGLPTSITCVSGIQFISIKWINPTEKDLAKIYIYRNTTNNSGTSIKIAEIDGTSYFDKDVVVGTLYYYWLKSIDTSENLSDFTVAVSGAPVNITASDLASSLSTRIDLVDAPTVGLVTKTDALRAQYTVKIDNNGFMSGFGLASDTVNGVPFSEFMALADRFAIINPSTAVKTISGITRTTTTATATSTAHGYLVADTVVVTGAAQNEYNGTKKITAVTADTFSYTVTGTPATPATLATGFVSFKAGKTDVPFVVDSGLVKINSAYIKELDAGKINTGTLDAARIAAGSLVVGKLDSSTQTNINNGSVVYNDPAARINAVSTTIDPGKILVSGSTTLSDWRHGSDNTKIDGGDIYANSITANKLNIGNRNISIQGIEISANYPVANTLYWGAGVITYVNDSGATTTANISASSVLWSTGTLYLYWTQGGTVLQTTTTASTAFSSNNIVLASYRGGTDLVANYGRTIVDGSDIVTGTITANQIATGTLTAAQIAAGTITADRMNVTDLSAISANIGTITTGTINATASVNAGAIKAGTISGQVVNLGDGNVQLDGTNSRLSIGDGVTSLNVTVGKIAVGNYGLHVKNTSGQDVVKIDNTGAVIQNVTVQNLVGNTINGLTITANNITSGTITGRTLQTASSGKRFVVDSSIGEAYFYDNLDRKLVSIGLLDDGGDNIIGYFGYGNRSDTSNNSIGVVGHSWGKTGVWGKSARGAGVYGTGESTIAGTHGVVGFVGGGGTGCNGVYGWSSGDGTGVRAYSTTGIGLRAESISGQPLRFTQLDSLPADRTNGGVCFFGGWLCFSNGTHWFRSNGTQLT